MRFHSAWIATIALFVGSSSIPPSQRACAAEPMDSAPLAKLIQQLDDERFKTRLAAEEEIRKGGATIVPQLQKALDKAPSLHVHRRLEMLIAELGNIGWNSDLPYAIKEAGKAGKPILVFSTIGEPKGFA